MPGMTKDLKEMTRMTRDDQECLAMTGMTRDDWDD